MRQRAAWCFLPVAPPGCTGRRREDTDPDPRPATPFRCWCGARLPSRPTPEGLIVMWPFKRSAGSVVIDPYLGDETARLLGAAAGRGDWQAVTTLLGPVEDQDLRAFYVGVLADRSGPQPW